MAKYERETGGLGAGAPSPPTLVDPSLTCCVVSSSFQRNRLERRRVLLARAVRQAGTRRSGRDPDEPVLRDGAVLGCVAPAEVTRSAGRDADERDRTVVSRAHRKQSGRKAYAYVRLTDPRSCLELRRGENARASFSKSSGGSGRPNK